MRCRPRTGDFFTVKGCSLSVAARSFGSCSDRVVDQRVELEAGTVYPGCYRWQRGVDGRSPSMIRRWSNVNVGSWFITGTPIRRCTNLLGWTLEVMRRFAGVRRYVVLHVGSLYAGYSSHSRVTHCSLVTHSLLTSHSLTSHYSRVIHESLTAHESLTTQESLTSHAMLTSHSLTTLESLTTHESLTSHATKRKTPESVHLHHGDPTVLPFIFKCNRPTIIYRTYTPSKLEME